MLITDGGMTTYVCDYCDRLLEFDRGTPWNELRSTAKKIGWRLFKVGTKWHSACPRHAGKNRRKR